MNAQRFVAPNSREAMALARAAFGDHAVILSSRSTDAGFEVVATSEEQLSAIAAQVATPAAQASRATLPETPTPRSARATLGLQQRAAAQLPPVSPDSTVAQDSETLAMSTLSFQEYVRERMLRKRREAMEGKLAAPAATPAARPSAPEATPVRATRADAAVTLAFGATAAGPAPAAPAPAAAAKPATPGGAAAQLTAQLEALKQLVDERFQTLAWLGQSRLHPIQSSLMHKFVRAGYSPTVARAVLQRLPEQLDAAAA